MAEPYTDPSTLKVLLDWAWAGCLGFIGFAKHLITSRFRSIDARLDKIEERTEVLRTETREQLHKIYDKLEDVRRLIYERTDGDGR